MVVVSRELFESIYGDDADERARRIQNGDYSALEDCPLVLGSIEDIGGRIERDMIRRAGVKRPHIVATSNNSETHLALCLRGAGACLCSETLARASLSDEQLDSLLLIRSGDAARYPIRFGFHEKQHLWSVIDEFMDIAIEVMSR